jgi:hypothetical protein
VPCLRSGASHKIEVSLVEGAHRRNEAYEFRFRVRKIAHQSDDPQKLFSAVGKLPSRTDSV